VTQHQSTGATVVETLPPHAQLVQMGMAHWVSHIVYVAAELGLADHLAAAAAGGAGGRGMTAEELAAKTATHAPSLYRLMRTLAGLGLFVEDADHHFALTPLGAALREGAPGAARATVLTLASDWWMRGFGQLGYSVRTGKPGFEKHLGMPIFDWLAKNPREASRFSETMVGFHGAETPAVAEAFDFSGFRTIVDVGGATGNLISAILERHPGPRGILYDLSHVLHDATPFIASRGLTDRITIEPGNFFERVPAGGDAYVLSHVIHDWSEEQCLTAATRTSSHTSSTTGPKSSA
jgi:hypothetical protein